MRLARCVLPALLLVLLPTPRQADRPDDDPPSRVGRLSFLSGSVSFRPGMVDDWTDATINYPLHAGDHLWTDTDARAELTVGSNAIRLAPQSAFGFLALDDRATQIRLSQGSVDVRVRTLGDDDSFEIDTPTGAISLLRPGTYRVDVDPTGDTTTVTVRHGQADVTAAGSAFAVHAGNAAVVSGGDSPSYDIRDAARPDEWEDWCSSRDRRWDDSRSSRYVSREIIGYEDLDDNGDWRDSPEYGPVWAPRKVVTGWAPYRYGHWAWVEPWGWTWIDDAPWGFAPFHYGRWVYWDGGWVWVPGRRVARPVYAPALVVFVGGSGVGVAWFPLAPEEPYVPGYRVSQTYIRNVNVTNVNVTNINVTNVNVTNITYRNRAAPGAVTVVSQETFVRARPVDKGILALARERLDQGRVVGSTARVAPDQHSVLGRPDIMTVHRPPPAVTTREVVVRREPPPPPVPFIVRERVLRVVAEPGPPPGRNPGTPLDLDLVRALRVNRSAVERRAATIPTRRTVKQEWQAAWLLRAITCIDLTTLQGDDTAGNVLRLCAKARQPVRQDLIEALGVRDLGIKVGAVCVYHAFVPTAITALEGSGIPVAAVSTGFPAGLNPLPQRLDEIRASVAAGAREIDVVITRAHALAGDWEALYQEIREFREACGPVHMKVILGTGDLATLVNVARASQVAMMAGADFIKTSTGKEQVNATLPVGVVMTRQIRDYHERTGHAVGFKPAGGIRKAKQALDWLILMKEELGDRWLSRDLFRLGASALLTDIERQLEHFVTGRYSAAHRHPMV